MVGPNQIACTEKVIIKAHISFNVFTNLYDATLLGGEFDNCHGQGSTPEGAMISLKLTVRARRNQKKKTHEFRRNFAQPRPAR